MIEVILELKFDSFLVNSMGDAGELLSPMPPRALRFSCGKVVSSRQLAGSAPSADFEFLSSSSKHESLLGDDKEFDDKLLNYLATHATVDVSRVDIAHESPARRTKPEEGNSSGIGRMVFTTAPNQSRLDLELVFKHDEFEDFWKLMTQQGIQKVIATLVCFKQKVHGADGSSESMLVAGVVSSSLRMMPNL